jgi:subtilisin
MKVKLIIISIILLLVMVFACGCIPIMEKLGLVNPANEEQLSSEKGGPPDGLVKVLIGFKEKPGAAQQAMVRGVGGKIKYTYHIVDAIAASIPQKAIDALQKNPNVRYVEPDGLVQALDTELDNSWGVKRIGAGLVHTSYKGTGIKVAIIDTGIDDYHPDLNVVDGKSFVDYTADYSDDEGHGTHVAGIVAALDNDIGVVGVAPEAFLYALKVLDETGRGYVSDIVAAIEWTTDPDGNPETDDSMDIINMSLGGGAHYTLEDACLSADNEGLLLVAAAGNSGNPPGRGDNVIYPAGYECVIAVAATDQNDERARWSSTGPAVELAAPGVVINSTLLGGGYGEKSGTSMASPHVAGVAALVIDAGFSDVRAQLKSTADDLGAAGWDSKYGWGLVDADEAAGVLPPPPNEPPTVSITSPVDGSIFDSGATILFEGTASDPEDGDITASLVWTSNIGGSIGAGGSFSMTLSDGTHTIAAEVTDSGGETGSDSISITVGTPSSNIMHVSDIYMSLKKAGINMNAIATVTIVDASAKPVGGATVSGTWSEATTDVDSGVTDTNGQVSLESDKVKNPPSGN